MTRGRCTDQKAARGAFGRFTHFRDRDLTPVGTGLDPLDDDLQGSRTDLNSLLRIQVECLAAVDKHERWLNDGLAAAL